MLSTLDTVYRCAFWRIPCTSICCQEDNRVPKGRLGWGYGYHACSVFPDTHPLFTPLNKEQSNGEFAKMSFLTDEADSCIGSDSS